MMRLDWVHSGAARTSKSRRYTIDVPEALVGTWATDRYSLWYDRIRAAMDRAVPRAQRAVQSIVQAEDRIDTGLMLSMASAIATYDGDELHLEFGWWGGLAEGGPGPYYAPFQEFGTSNGIAPMLAVQRTYHQELGKLRNVVAG